MNTYLPNMRSSIKSEVFDRQIDRMFDEVLGQFHPTGSQWVQGCTVWEDEGGFYVQLALPGWEPSELTLEVNHGVLTVTGQHASEDPGVFDVVGGEFTRTFRLPRICQSRQSQGSVCKRIADYFISKTHRGKASSHSYRCGITDRLSDKGGIYAHSERSRKQ